MLCVLCELADATPSAVDTTPLPANSMACISRFESVIGSPFVRCIRRGVLFVATEVAQPGPEQQAYTDSRRTILLDDGLAVSDPKPARYPAPGALLSAPDAASQSMVLLPAWQC